MLNFAIMINAPSIFIFGGLFSRNGRFNSTKRGSLCRSWANSSGLPSGNFGYSTTAVFDRGQCVVDVGVSVGIGIGAPLSVRVWRRIGKQSTERLELIVLVCLVVVAARVRRRHRCRFLSFLLVLVQALLLPLQLTRFAQLVNEVFGACRWLKEPARTCRSLGAVGSRLGDVALVSCSCNCSRLCCAMRGRRWLARRRVASHAANRWASASPLHHSVCTTEWRCSRPPLRPIQYSIHYTVCKRSAIEWHRITIIRQVEHEIYSTFKRRPLLFASSARNSSGESQWASLASEYAACTWSSRTRDSTAPM